MNKIRTPKFSRSKLFFSLIIFSVLIASRNLFKPGFFPMHDDLQVGRLYQMELCFRDRQIPCRWVPDMGYSYGYPLFNFYPPFPYYLGMIFRGLGFSLIDSIKILFVLGFFASAFFMFLLGKELWGEIGGLVSSVFYLFAPYHSVDVYVRGAMNEFWALAWFPLIFWSVLKVIRSENSKYILILALSYCLLLLTHNVMTMIFTPFIVVWGVVLILLGRKNWRQKTLALLTGGLWGVGLAAFFFLPVIFEREYVHTETMLMGYFNYLAHFVGLRKTLFTRFWGYGSSGWLQEAGMPFQVGIPQWPVAVLVFLTSALLFLKKKIKIGKFLLFLFFFFLFIISLFMIHPRSVFIWQKIKILEYVQFPWRFLALVIFGISILGGGLVYLLKIEKLKMLTGLVLILLTTALNYSFFRPEKMININDKEKLFSAKGWNKLQTDAIFDYLPKYAYQPPGGPAPEKPEIKQGEAEIYEIKRGTNWYEFKLKVYKEAKIQIPLYDFPEWKVWIDGELAKITHDNFLGLITIKVPMGNHFVRAKLTDTPIRTLGNIISIISWLFFIIFLIKIEIFIKKC